MSQVSFCIGTYNVEAYIVQCLDSILLQSYQNKQIVLIDDASTDSTVEVIHGWIEKHKDDISVIFLQNPTNKWPAFSYNQAIKNATGEFLCIMDSDDFFTADFLTSRLEKFKENPELQVVYGNGVYFSNNSHWDELHVDILETFKSDISTIQNYLVTKVPVLLLQSTVVRKDFFENAVGWFDEELLSNDWVANIRIFKNIQSHKEFTMDTNPVFAYRVHSASISKDQKRMFTLLSQVVAKYTPKSLQSIGNANVAYLIALGFLRQWNRKDALEYFHKSQRNEISVKKFIIFIISFLLPTSVISGQSRLFNYAKRLVLKYLQ